MDQLPETETSFAVILDEGQIPPRIYLVHNNADPFVDGKEGKPEGIGLPGGGREIYKRIRVSCNDPDCESYEDGPHYHYEIQGDKTPRHTARREVQKETGLRVVLANWGSASRYGEILCEPKPWINNTVRVFHMCRVNGVSSLIEEADETGRDMRATLGNILKMPLAVNKEKAIYNSQGIYYKHRERLLLALDALDYNFCELIPNLSELIKKIQREDVGDLIYDMLYSALQAEGVTKPLERVSDEELVELHCDYGVRLLATYNIKEDEEERRRWANG